LRATSLKWQEEKRKTSQRGQLSGSPAHFNAGQAYTAQNQMPPQATSGGIRTTGPFTPTNPYYQPSGIPLSPPNYSSERAASYYPQDDHPGDYYGNDEEMNHDPPDPLTASAPQTREMELEMMRKGSGHSGSRKRPQS